MNAVGRVEIQCVSNGAPRKWGVLSEARWSGAESVSGVEECSDEVEPKAESSEGVAMSEAR